MGFFKDLVDTGSSIATGGMYSTGGNGLLQGGNPVRGILANTTKGASELVGFGSNLVNKTGLYGDGSKYDPNAGLGGSNAQIMNNSSQRSADKISKFYGSSLDGIGQESTDYANRTKGNLDKNVAEADLYNQQAGQQRALDNARAGLSGVDTSAMNEQSRRNASFGAAAINESAKRNALDLYGQSISNRITGANTIDTQEQALGIASLQQPVAQASNNGGILSSIFGGIF